jgi:DNA polymerase III subunit gamma/tau
MENFIVSARKYRPSTFGMVVGQPNIVQTLKNAISNNSLAQAFLFTGPRGIGKTTCARILAKTINCLNLQPDTEPCNECESCRSFNQLASFNIQELDAASNNSVDDIRTLVDQVRIPPQAGKYKVYIIDEVHMLSASAFNAFLKTLEEPPAYAKFILATTERHKILPTILSRCQIYDFKRITVTDIAKHLAWVAGQEQFTFEEEALHIIAQKADGALRDALSIFDQIVSFSGKHITYQHVIENLNMLDYEYYFRIMQCIHHYDIPGSLLILDEIINKGFDGHHFISGIGEHLRSLLLCKDASIAQLLEASDAIKIRYHEQSKLFSMVWLVQALDLVAKADLSYRTATNKRLHLELMLLQMNEFNRNSEEKKKPEPGDPPAHAPNPSRPAPQVAPVASPVSTTLPVTTTPQVAPGLDQPKPTENNSVPAADALPQQPPPTPVQSPPAPVQPTSTPVQPPSTPAAPLATQKKRLSIKDLMESSGATDSEEEDQALIKPDRAIQPLDTTEVQSIIKRYAEQIALEYPSFAAAITARPISIAPENRILLTLSNKINADPEHLRNLSVHIRSQVSESWFTLEPVIEEMVVEEKHILSPRERYARFTDHTPGVDPFVKRLGLEFEE